MKIGEFAKKNDITIDTVRHYIDLGLILPIKKTGQYDFDIRCEKDIKDIQRFKEMKFSLNEIKEILTFKTLGNLDGGESKGFLEKIYFEDDLNYFDVENYMKATDKEFLKTIKNMIEWIIKQIDFDSLKGKVILELGIGVCFLLRN